MTEPVTPDCEALIAAVLEVGEPGWVGGEFIIGPVPPEVVVDAILPLLTDALNRAYQRGRADHLADLIREGPELPAVEDDMQRFWRDALDRARQQGREDAAQAIRLGSYACADEGGLMSPGYAVRLAHGADRKDEG